MDKFVKALCLMVALGMVVLVFPDGVTALIVVLMLSAPALFIFRKFTEKKDFVTSVFLAALVVRLLFGLFVHVFELREFFGGDANTYSYRGSKLLGYWMGIVNVNDPDLPTAMSTTGPGWGMNYLVASLYWLFGKNMFAAQSFCAVFGAATAPMVYYCAQKIYSNDRVAKCSAIAIALFPSFIIWSSQLMKDGLIIFLLVLVVTMVLQLQKSFSYLSLLLLVFSLFGIISLRFYIFYMVAIAVAGSFVLGVTNSIASVARRGVVLVLLGLSLTYLGVIRNASVDLETFGDLEKVQNSRLDLSRSAETGFNEEVDVSTPTGAISAIPIGLAYLMLAPFPWQMTNLRQAITLPEVLLWWAMIPLMIWGFWYTVKHRLRTAFPILIFSIMLTLAYSIFQGNVGTAYRQRAQIQVFLFMFIAAGWVLYRERAEDKKMIQSAKNQRFDRGVRAGA